MVDLRRFGRRVRLVRAWRGAAIGACAGALAASAWSALDWSGQADASLVGLTLLLLGGALAGAAVASSLHVSAAALRISVDRRAGLQNRLTATVVDVPFAREIVEDAEARLQGIRPADLYPFRVGRWHGGALAAMALAASVFLLGSTPILLSPAAKAERKELAAKGAAVQRIERARFETPEAQREMSSAERRLAEEARRLQRDLEKGRLNREETRQRASELQRKAEGLAKAAAGESQRALAHAETAMEKMERAALDGAGQGAADRSLAAMPPGTRESLRAQNAARQAELEKRMAAIDARLAETANRLARRGLGEAERKALEAEAKRLKAQKEALEREARQARKEGEALKLSDEANATLQKMRNHELMKEIRKLAAELAKSNAQAMRNGQPKLTPEQRAEMKRKLEELLSSLKDDAAMREYLEQTLEAMRSGMLKAGQCERPGGFGMGLLSLFGLPGGPDAGPDGAFFDTGHVNRLAKPEAGKGKTFETQVGGARRESGEESFVEIKAPTTVGNRTSVPYRSVLPSYQKKAEQALDRKAIPKEHEKRVREYFESLRRGR